jgi:hypothetical protein
VSLSRSPRSTRKQSSSVKEKPGKTTAEFRVRWRRVTWRPWVMASRRYSRRSNADVLLAKLVRDGRPELGRLEYVRVEARIIYAGPWRVLDDRGSK